MKLLSPHFSGVHKGKGPNPNACFYSYDNDNQPYHASGEDLALLTQYQNAQFEESKAPGYMPFQSWIPTADTAKSRLVALLDQLVAKEPNNQFESALKRKSSTKALALLHHPEVTLSESDQAGSQDFAKRLLQPDSFKRLSKILGNDTEARDFVKRVLTRDILNDLGAGISSEWKASTHTKLENSAKDLAEQTIQEHTDPFKHLLDRTLLS